MPADRHETLARRARAGHLRALAQESAERNDAELDRLRRDAEFVAQRRTGERSLLHRRRGLLAAAREAGEAALRVNVRAGIDAERDWLCGKLRDTQPNRPEELKETVVRWLPVAMEDAAAAVDVAAEALIENAMTSHDGIDLTHPGSMAVAEEITIRPAIDVGTVEGARATAGEVGGAAAVGLALGTMILPGPGSLAGAAIGAFLGMFGGSEPDYVAAYVARVEAKWPDIRDHLLTVGSAQLRRRLDDLLEQVDAQDRRLAALPDDRQAEVEARQAAADSLRALMEQAG